MTMHTIGLTWGCEMRRSWLAGIALACLPAIALAQSSAGGGGGGGSGGTVSVSNFPATQPVSGTFWQATQPVSGSVSAAQSGTWTFGLTGPIPAGSNVIGAVTQSGGPWAVSGTVAATQSGTWAVGLTVGGTALANGNPVPISIPNVQAALGANPGQALMVQGDVQTARPMPTVEMGSAFATAGIAPSLNGVTAVTAKAAAGNLYGVYALNTTTTAGFLVVANVAAVPSSGAAVTPTECVPLPANGTATINYGPGPADYYGTGITVMMSTACTSYTPGSMAGFLKPRVR